VLSNAVSSDPQYTDTGVTLSFSNSLSDGPTVTSVTVNGVPNKTAIPSSTALASVLSGNSITLSRDATRTGNATLNFTLTAAEEQQRLSLNNTLQQIVLQENNALKQLGANVEMDYLQGGAGKDALYAGENPVWMVGGPNAGQHTFYITPANYGNFAQDNVQGGSGTYHTLMFQGDGTMSISTPDKGITDVVKINDQSFTWAEGHNISTVGVQTLGGTDNVTIGNTDNLTLDSVRFGASSAGTTTIRVEDGGDLNDP